LNATTLLFKFRDPIFGSLNEVSKCGRCWLSEVVQSKK
jgi:hypothetical protein